MNDRTKRVIVVGAGITGLTTAHSLLRDRPRTDVVVLESSPRVGGKIATAEFAGRPVDCAADAFLARVPDAVDLCHELGLTRELVSPASRTAYVFADGRLRQFPTGAVLGVPTDLEALERSGIVSTDAAARAERDLALREAVRNDDESVGALVRRRVGDEVFETLVAPLLSGVYAGDADELSVAVAAPQFVAAINEHGSLIAGLRAQAARADRDAPVFYGLRGGTQTLVDALVRTIDEHGGRISLQQRADRLEPMHARTRVILDNGDALDADAVVLATPDFAMASMLAPTLPEVAHELAEVRYASVAMVAFAVAAAAFSEPLDGTGFLVPRREGLLLTACSWASNKWAHLRGDPVILRASAGRIDDERAFHLTDDALVAQLAADLGTTMGLPRELIDSRVTRWPQALPQFAPGHLGRVDRWREQLQQAMPGVTLAGAGIGGLGIPACIRQGRLAADHVRATALS